MQYVLQGDMPAPSPLAERLLWARTSAGISIGQAIAQLGPVGTDLFSAEGGDPLTPEAAQTIADLYEVDVTWLTTGVERVLDSAALAALPSLPETSREEVLTLLRRIASPRLTEPVTGLKHIQQLLRDDRPEPPGSSTLVADSVIVREVTHLGWMLGRSVVLGIQVAEEEPPRFVDVACTEAVAQRLLSDLTRILASIAPSPTESSSLEPPMFTPRTVPIQPFDDTLRTRIVRAIGEAFEETHRLHGCDYDPDTVDNAADRVIAMLVSGLLGVHVEVLPQAVIGNGTLRIHPGRSAFDQELVNARNEPVAPRRTLSQAVVDVLAEHQLSTGRYSAEHDDAHGDELAQAASYYAAPQGIEVGPTEDWVKELYEKHRSRGQTDREALVRSAAFAISAIEVLDRTAKAKFDAAAQAELRTRTRR